MQGPRPGQLLDIDERLRKDLPSTSRLWDFGPQTYDEQKFGDFVSAAWAIEQLKKSHDKPFFLSVGFYRPHVPWYAPKRIFDQIDHTTLHLPPVKSDDGDDLPDIAKRITFNGLPPAHAWWQQSDHWQAGIEAYHASVRFTDEQVGRLLDALDGSGHANNTIIVFFSDHGFFWEKSSGGPNSPYGNAQHIFHLSSPLPGLRLAGAPDRWNC